MSRETSHLQQEQVERLMQIGAYLRHVREENGLSLEDVAERTLIQSRMLKAIEEGKLHYLPEPVYVQGFIRRYADAMGLDGGEFAEAFPAEKSLHLGQSSWKDSPAAQLRPLHLYLAYIALIVASVSLLSYIVGRSATTTATSLQLAPTQTTAVPPSPITSTERIAANSSRAVASPKVQTKPVQVDVKLTSQSWLEVEVDGQIKLAEVLAEGTERSWSGDRQVRIRAGNAGGVLVAHNGGKATPMGVPGAVEEKTFSPAAKPAPIAPTAPEGSPAASPTDAPPAGSAAPNQSSSSPVPSPAPSPQ
ncbi:MAG: helix-turn-helix domain-containing protein [Elainella sp.]